MKICDEFAISRTSTVLGQSALAWQLTCACARPADRTEHLRVRPQKVPP